MWSFPTPRFYGSDNFDLHSSTNEESFLLNNKMQNVPKPSQKKGTIYGYSH